jgi:flagellar hook protein FlgE
MNSSFYNGVSGTKTHQFGMDVWANNISNVNNDGYRSSTPEFSSIFATTMTDTYYGVAMSDKSYGSQSQTTALNLSQGPLRTTDNPFDLALGDEGWFGIRGQDGVDYYTRTGSFTFDGNGTLVDQNGFKLLGTLGNNITSTEIEASKLVTYGHVYGVDERRLVDGYAITKIESITLTAPTAQSEITLPDNLYMPATPTQNITVKANLDAKPDVKTTDIPLNEADYQSIISLAETLEDEENEELAFTPSSTLNSDGTITLQGSIINTEGIMNPQAQDGVLITITDANGKSVQRSASLDEDLQTWKLKNARISELDTTGELTITATIRTQQEVPNEERFTTTVISPNGDKDILDLRFTQQLPQTGDTTTWDANAKILKYYEPYEILQYDPSQTYDKDLYTIENGQVIKNYDPEEFYVDTNAKKVYKIIDTQEGEITFTGSGALLNHTLGTLDNSGYDLTLNLGESYQSDVITNFEQNTVDNVMKVSGEGLTQGDSLQITINDGQGHAITQSVTAKEDGTWEFNHDVSAFDTENTTVEVIHVIDSGWNGVVSNTALDKATVIQDEDGIAEGHLVDYSMDGQGQIVAQFTNSQSIPVAKIAVYHFQNDQGLSSLTGNHFQATVNSGDPIFYTDANGNFIQNTAIMSNRLEGSNVNLATALTELIVIQKAFSGNAKSITTSDEMIQNAIQMKR